MDTINKHCVIGVRIRSYFGPHFPSLSISPYSVQMCRCADQNNCEYGHFSRRETDASIDLIIFAQKVGLDKVTFKTWIVVTIKTRERRATLNEKFSIILIVDFEQVETKFRSLTDTMIELC